MPICAHSKHGAWEECIERLASDFCTEQGLSSVFREWPSVVAPVPSVYVDERFYVDKRFCVNLAENASVTYYQPCSGLLIA